MRVQVCVDEVHEGIFEARYRVEGKDWVGFYRSMKESSAVAVACDFAWRHRAQGYQVQLSRTTGRIH